MEFPVPTKLHKRRVINSAIDAIPFQTAIDRIFELAENKTSSYVCFANVHMIVEAFNDSRFQKMINRADLALPDGLPLSKYIGLFDGISQDRIAGPDVMPVVLARAAREGKSVYFYGGTEFMLHILKERAQKDHPGLCIAGSYAPPFRPLSSFEEEEITAKINASQADFVFVCLGCPKQEKWMHEHRDTIQACMLGVGQAFSIYAGLADRAPLFMQKNGLEWVYRLFKEPRRLAKRYFYTNGVFLYLVSRLYFRKVRKKELLPI